jgi:hypothetical protein
MYKKYNCLVEGLRQNGPFGQYYTSINLIKDPIIAFSIILLWKNEFFQVVIPLTIMLFFSIMECWRDPIVNKREGTVSKFTKVLFTIIMSVYLVLVFHAPGMKASTLSNVYGYPIIFLYICVILTAIVPIFLEAKDKLKKRCNKNRNKVKQDNSGAKNSSLDESANFGLVQNANGPGAVGVVSNIAKNDGTILPENQYSVKNVGKKISIKRQISTVK